MPTAQDEPAFRISAVNLARRSAESTERPDGSRNTEAKTVIVRPSTRSTETVWGVEDTPTTSARETTFVGGEHARTVKDSCDTSSAGFGATAIHTHFTARTTAAARLTNPTALPTPG